MGVYFDRAAETADREELTARQSAGLVKTVRRAYGNVRYYRERMDAAGVSPDDIKSIGDLHKLPFLCKDDLRDTYPYGLAACKMEDAIRIHASSGTTGKPVVALYTRGDVERWAECAARCLVMSNAAKGDIIHISYGYGLFTGGLGLHYGTERLGAVALPASSGNTARQITMLRDFGSSVICCTPSYALYIGDVLAQTGVSKGELKLKSGIFGAEPWTDGMRLEIEKALRLEAFDIYGLTEISGPGVSCECGEHAGLHVNEDHFYPEIINPETGEVLPEGERGELVLSTITKEGMPLLRYRTRDITSLNYEPCKCGRTLVRMERLSGRIDDMLIIRGVNVFPSQIESVLLQIGGEIAPHYHIVADRAGKLDTLEVQVEMSEAFFSDEVRKIEALQNKIRASLYSAININPIVTLVEPRALARSEGKAKRVTDKRNLKG